MSKKKKDAPTTTGTVSEAYEKAIKIYFDRLKEIDSDLAEKVQTYLLTGESSEVLLQLGGIANAGEVLYLAGITGKNYNWELARHVAAMLSNIYKEAKDQSINTLVRLGEVLAAMRSAAGKVINTTDGKPSWLIALVGEMTSVWYNQYPRQTILPVTKFEEIFVEAGLSSEDVLRGLLDSDGFAFIRNSGFWFYGDIHELVSGLPAYLQKHLDILRPFLPSIKSRAQHTIRQLNQIKFDYEPILETIVELGVCESKGVREDALPILMKYPEKALPLAQKMLAEGSASQRHEAALLCWKLDGEKALPILKTHLETEKAERVRQTIEKLIAAPIEEAADAGRDVKFEIPPLNLQLGVVPFSEECREKIRQFFEGCYQQAYQSYQSQLEQWNSPNKPTWMSKPVEPHRISKAHLDHLFAFVEGTEKDISTEQYVKNSVYNKKPFDDWFAPPQVQLIHFVRLLYAIGMINTHNGFNYWNTVDLDPYRSLSPEPFGIRELDAVVATLPKATPGMVLQHYLWNNTSYREFCNWEPDAIWPAFAENINLLKDTITGVNRTSGYYYYGESRRNAFRVLAMFPKLPPGFMNILWDLALSETKTDRPLAQDALKTIPEKAKKVLVALKDGRQGIRAAAAEWLGQIGDPSVIEEMKEAFRTEKQEAVKGLIMASLEKLGADVNEFLDRKKLEKEAKAAVAKKKPAGMEWVPLDRLPKLHWQDTGKAVPTEVVQWWIIQSIQQKLPTCGPILKRYLQMIQPLEATAFAKMILATWIGYDTRHPSAEECATRAQKDADYQWNHCGDWFKTQYGTKENVYALLYKNYSNELVGSAINQKGMLGIVQAAGDGDCIKMMESYIRKYFGQRLSQCKAFIEVMSGMKHPLALQVLLAIANRFRTKALRKQAEDTVNAIAEREGWTVDELADRTIPDAGFARPEDEEGKPIGTEAILTLEYGSRNFTVKLNDELEPIIQNEEGKIIKNLPNAAKDDDAELAKAAKKTFSDAKKQVKEVVKRQAERLYEALCTQRSWTYSDWRTYLADHPIVGRQCVRLAWAAFEPGEGGKFLGCFRPLEDGSLTNEQDEEVKFSPETIIRIAHAANTSAEIGSAWVQHFQDYDVQPLFVQFGREIYTLPENKKKESEINDFEGHCLTTFQLRGKANNLGYIRGEAEDGGWFYVYRKPFSSLQLQAVLGFTGSMLPEENIPCALQTLYFTRMRKDGESSYSWNESKLDLGKVPAVLLSECYNDVKQMAAEGTGFDPEWQKKSYY